MMKRILVAIALTGCSGSPGTLEPDGDTGRRGDVGVIECASTADCSFGERCIGGMCTQEPLAPEVGCVDDGDCSVGEACAVSSGTCVRIADAPDPQVETVPDCVDGDTRPCGSKVGRCEYGSQVCSAGVWQTCTGGVTPASFEDCNGLDDDCDGVVPSVELDMDGDSVSACAGDCDDADSTVYPGGTEVCDGKNNDCDADTDEGTDSQCDDGIFCNGTESCQLGACGPGTAPDCSSFDDACNAGTCDESTQGCSATPVTDGTACDDSLFCTTGTTCSAGACVGGTPTDCGVAADQCNDGVCNETLGQCEPQPMLDGTSCDDGLSCNENEACVGGSCTGGNAVNCAATGCRDGTCSEASGGCTAGSPINEGSGCDDGLFCTNGETCQSGNCTGGVTRDCDAEVGDACNAGVCDASAEAANVCSRVPVADGTGCNDNQFCTDGDTCQAGACQSGAPLDCSGAGDQCNDGSCNESTDACEPSPKADGVGCNDTLYCSVGDVCLGGGCTGSARDCSAFLDDCNLGVCNEGSDACEAQPRADGTGCTDGLFCTDGDTCQSGACAAGPVRDCSGVADACNDGACDEAINQCVPIDNGSCNCDPGIDADFDGSNECDDCDDNNGGVFPNAAERCNGIDDNCNTLIDEDFDIDGDFYSVCAQDPALVDCNDNDITINPGAAEDCGPGGDGNGIDENCNGYIDEGCAPCTTTDDDGDGVSDCDGDCDDNEPNSTPGAPELCDGIDNDCNVFTIDNCDVSDPCNFAPGTDECKDDLLCACIVNAAGNCTGNYQCTSYCNTSATGPLGDACTATQTCALDLLQSAAVHGCSESAATPGTKFGGVACNDDAECRSGACERIILGGPGQKEYCWDYCGSDAYCPAGGTVCRLFYTGSDMDGRCWPDNRPGVGSTAVGSSCTLDSQCDHGFCADEGNDGGPLYCSEPCCQDSDCPGGYTCGLRGDQVATNFVTIPPGAPPCTVDADCPTGMECFTTSGECSWRLSETSPMCLLDVSGQDSRPAGAACTLNRDCASNFCEATLNVCVDVCCSDATCPTGLACELTYIQTTDDLATSARVCLNLSTDQVLVRK